MLVDAALANGKMFEEEHMRMINIVTSMHPGAVGGGIRFPKGIMEHKVIQNLRALSGNKGLLRQWHQEFTTALGQVMTKCGEIVHRLAREIDLGKDMENILSTLARDHGLVFEEASLDL